jgi:hypothetical protein
MTVCPSACPYLTTHTDNGLNDFHKIWHPGVLLNCIYTGRVFNPTTIMNTLYEKLRSFLRESQLKLTKHFTLSENCFLQPFTLEQEMKREKKASVSLSVTVGDI